MIVLGIESSCDETAVALIERGTTNRVIHEEIKSQIPLHAIYGGIVPEIASRNHYEVIDLLAKNVLEKSACKPGDVELLAVTKGPGLIGSLLVGLSFAKGWSISQKIPLVGVDHLQAHIEAAHISAEEIKHPLLALVVSGGHTSLFFQEGRFSGKTIAKTRDDAAGEVLDKAAKYFSLGYPGGPLLERIALRAEKNTFSFSMPRMTDGSNDFSFSGYKTALLRLAAEEKINSQSEAFPDLIASFVNDICDYLVSKTIIAAQNLGCRTVVVSGGVSRNTILRKKFLLAAEKDELRLFMPEPAYCTDNASMVAWLGYEMFRAFPDYNYHDRNLNCYARIQGKGKQKHR